MPFSIHFVDDSVPAESTARYGVIRIGEFSERFLASLEYWSASQYERQWRKALTRICCGETVSALITSVRDPLTTIGVAWWPLHRTGDHVHVQNAIQFFDQLETPFDLANPYTSVPGRAVVTGDGDPISEWSTMVADLNAFLSNGETQIHFER